MAGGLESLSGAVSAAVSVRGEATPRFNSDLAQMWLGITAVALTVFVPDMLGNPYWTHSFQVVNVLLPAIICQNILMNDAGQVSFGQSAIFGMGAYMAAIAAGLHGVPYGIAMILGVAAAVLAGLLYALPALRVQGYYLGFVTLSAGAAFPEMLAALNSYTKGINGISMQFPGWHGKAALGIS